MLNNVALDVFIGLIFVLLVYSLLATVLQEIIARILDLRGKNLIKAMRVMLEDREEISGGYWTRMFHHLSSNIKHFRCPFPREDSMAKAFYSHPTIKYLSQSSWRSKPSYMGSYNFSTTIIKLLRGKNFDGSADQMQAIKTTLFAEVATVVSGSPTNTVKANIDPETLDQLKQLFLDSKDVAEFKLHLERWFDETMERASGWYKKQTQLILFIVGLTIAIAFNADTFAIYNILSKDKKAREEFVQLASNATIKYDTLNKQLIKTPVKDSFPVTKKDSLGKIDTTGWSYKTTLKILLSDTSLNQAKKMLITDIENANNILGLGRTWNDTCASCKKNSCHCTTIENCADKNCVNNRSCLQWHPLQRGGIITIFGWIIMALGISLGAPFWFDMLGKIMQIRGSGAKPKEPEPEKK